MGGTVKRVGRAAWLAARVLARASSGLLLMGIGLALAGGGVWTLLRVELGLWDAVGVALFVVIGLCVAFMGVLVLIGRLRSGGRGASSAGGGVYGAYGGTYHGGDGGGFGGGGDGGGGGY